MKIRPLADKLLVRRKEGAAKLGSILIPETAKEVPSEGEVLAAGNECLDVKTGDVVLFSKYAGTEVKASDGKLALMLREEDILAIVEGK